jgi:8-oxo-dGTP pyrophosphatase MutT (NUDIX family)
MAQPAEPHVVRLDSLALEFAPRPWRFTETRRAEIDAHFDRLRGAKPALWNGRVLLLHDHELAGRVLRGCYLETDFASFLAWRDWGFPDPAIRNCFALGALLCGDGAFLLGVMAESTANAGMIYFPGGTPEPADVVGGMVDLEGSVRREVAEETRLNIDDLAIEAGWHALFCGPRIALIKIMRAPDEAEALRARILAALAREPAPELSDLRIVRDARDLDPRMPAFVVTFLRHRWGALANQGEER